MRSVLEPRKMHILQAITDDYIATAEPVGSRTIARRYRLGVSPATIRNEMSDLEELGYLEQPHTSAGRIPSDKGYRFYVDVLMDRAEVPREERDRMRQEVLARQRAMEEMIHRAARILSLLTQYTAVVLAPRISRTAIRRFHLSSIDERHVLVVVVTDPGFVQHHIVEMPHSISDEELARLSQKINDRVVGKSWREITRSLLSDLREELEPARLYEEVVDQVMRSLDTQGGEKVYLDGTLHLFEQPEFHDVERAKALLSFLEQEEAVAAILSEVARHSGTSVIIGKEHRRVEMQGCSMVAANYRIREQVIGTVGVVGPTRMDYSRVVAIVNVLADSLSDILTALSHRER